MFVSIINMLALIASLFLGVCYYYLRQRFQYWSQRRIPQLEPVNLIFGNCMDVIFGRITLAEYAARAYNQLAPHKFAGIYNFQKPTLIIRDPELIGQVLVKDFSHFVDHDDHLVRKNKPISFHLFNLTGNAWQTLRQKLTPVFSSGKMKKMFDLVKECADDLQNVFEGHIQKGDVEIKDLLARYTTDVISSCAFGIRSNSLFDPECELRQIGRKIFNSSIINDVKVLWPEAVKFLNMSYVDPQASRKLHIIMQDIIKHRENNKIERNDFLNLLLSLRSQEEACNENQGLNASNQSGFPIDFNAEVIFAHVFIFYAAGFETSSSTLSFLLFELAKNTAIQKKLQLAIDTVIYENGGKITYDCIQNIYYMDQVISESLRLHPIIPQLERVCTAEYCIPETDIVIEKGTRLYIPVAGLHYDPKYYANPTTFDPEHFSKQAKASRPHFTHLPFGEGPRMCIGLRFGLMQVKLALVTLLRHYEFTISKKMKLPLDVFKHGKAASPEGEIWLSCHRRSGRKVKQNE